MIPKNYIQIAEIFHKAFNEFYFAEVHGNQAIEFQNYISFCSVALPAFEKFEKVCKATASCYEKINSSQNVLMQSLQQVNSFCTKNYSSKLVQVDEKEEMCNSFLLVLDWARGEILDLKAMLEGIQKQLGFAKQYEYFREKLLQKQKGLEGLKQGKKSISSVFSTKSADVQQKTQKKSVESLEYDLKGLELIERINAERLLKIELPLFKQKKVQSLSSVLKLFGESIHTELEKYRNQTRILEASLNNNND